MIQMLTQPAKRFSADETKPFAAGGAIFRAIENKAVSEIGRPCSDAELDTFAAGIADALEADDDLAGESNLTDEASVRRALIFGVRRTRPGSGGSWGRQTWLRLRTPLKAYDGDATLYLKETIPSDAERTGQLTRDPVARRRDDTNRLTAPRPFLSAAVRVGGRSYWLNFKESCGSPMECDDIESFARLQRVARVWGTVAGATHREDGRFEMILPRLTAALRQVIRERALAYALKQAADYANFAGGGRERPVVTPAGGVEPAGGRS